MVSNTLSKIIYLIFHSLLEFFYLTNEMVTSIIAKLLGIIPNSLRIFFNLILQFIKTTSVVIISVVAGNLNIRPQLRNLVSQLEAEIFHNT